MYSPGSIPKAVTTRAISDFPVAGARDAKEAAETACIYIYIYIYNIYIYIYIYIYMYDSEKKGILTAKRPTPTPLRSASEVSRAPDIRTLEVVPSRGQGQFLGSDI